MHANLRGKGSFPRRHPIPRQGCPLPAPSARPAGKPWGAPLHAASSLARPAEEGAAGGGCPQAGTAPSSLPRRSLRLGGSSPQLPGDLPALLCPEGSQPGYQGLGGPGPARRKGCRQRGRSRRGIPRSCQGAPRPPLPIPAALTRSRACRSASASRCRCSARSSASSATCCRLWIFFLTASMELELAMAGAAPGGHTADPFVGSARLGQEALRQRPLPPPALPPSLPAPPPPPAAAPAAAASDRPAPPLPRASRAVLTHGRREFPRREGCTEPLISNRTEGAPGQGA